MPSRTSDWSESISKDLRDTEFAQIFLLGLLEEGDDLQTALSRLIRNYGVKEYASLVEMEPSAIQRAIDPRHNPTKSTLEKLLAPLKLTLGVKPAA